MELILDLSSITSIGAVRNTILPMQKLYFRPFRFRIGTEIICFEQPLESKVSDTELILDLTSFCTVYTVLTVNPEDEKLPVKYILLGLYVNERPRFTAVKIQLTLYWRRFANLDTEMEPTTITFTFLQHDVTKNALGSAATVPVRDKTACHQSEAVESAGPRQSGGSAHVQRYV